MRMNRLPLQTLAIIAVGLPAMAACGDGAVAHSQPIALQLGSIKDDELPNDAFSEEKSVNSETGNPYAAFLAAARAELGGQEPRAIEVEKILLDVDSDSKGIGSGGFSEIFANVEAFLADDRATIAVGKLETLDPGTSLEIPINAEEEELEALQPRLIQGSFKVGIRGDGAANRPADFELKVNMRVTFRALD